MKSRWTRWIWWAAAVLTAAMPLAGLAQPAAAGAPAVLALYEGADRLSRIAPAAKKEGSLLLYTTIAATSMEKIGADFEQRYGVKVNVWRAGTDKLMQRVLTEARSNRFDADAIHFGSPEMEALHREKLLQEVRSPHHRNLVQGAVPPHRSWAATYLNVYALAYNTNKVRKEELPKTYQDLLEPRWRGRLGVEAKDQEWFLGIVKDMGEARGLEYFRALVAANGPSVRIGHTVLANMVVSGEVPLALTVFSYMPEQLKRKGAPIDWFLLEPVVIRPNAIGVMRRAPHPNAALLFYEYMLGEGQQLLSDMAYVPAARREESSLRNLRIRILDPVEVLDENDKWSRLYADVVTRQSR